jgi:hypothetical protein
LEQHEQTWKPATEELETINMGNDQSKKELKIGTLITPEQRIVMIAPLQEYADVFAWSYEDMPGLDSNIVVHKIPLEEVIRISPTLSVIMPTTHWRCQLGQSQELGRRSLKKH